MALFIQLARLRFVSRGIGELATSVAVRGVQPSDQVAKLFCSSAFIKHSKSVSKCSNKELPVIQTTGDLFG